MTEWGAALVAVILIGGTTYALPSLPSSERDTSQEQAEIQSIVAAMTEAFNRHDADAATAMYADDADFVSVRGEVGHGRGAARDGLAKIFATRAREAKLTTLDVRIRFLAPGMAIAHVTNELSGLIAPDGSRPPPHREISLRIFQRTAAGWRMEAFQNTLVRPFE